ncbi:chaperonin 10-like protein [Xylogone sp. PMI_703]|nr:chaperonin 10-like protein [Xylogone sp. PMI_703]
MATIPKQHKAAIYADPGKLLTKIEKLDTPEPGTGEVLVNITHSGVCHSDLEVMINSWAALPYPTQSGQVGGHEGIGLIAKLGPGVEASGLKVGDRVGVKWVSGICGVCPACLEGADGLCFNVKISGYYTPGTFQEYVLSPANYVTPIPESLDSVEAALLLCAARSGQWVVISGAGGGLGHIAVQLAEAMGLRIIGIDYGSKEAFVKGCGAEVFLDITKHDDKNMVEEVKKAAGGLGASAVLVCTASNKAYAQAIDFLRFGGTLVCVGVPAGKLEPIASAFPASIVFKQLNIAGTAVGNRQDAAEVLDFAARGVIKVHTRVESLEKLDEVFREMSTGKLVGRVVIAL